MKLVFFGTPDFAVPSIESLVRSRHELAAVVTQPDRPKGRGLKTVPSPVKRVARKHGLDILQPERASTAEFVQKVRSLAPDLLVVVAYGEILRPELLEGARHGAVNLHASLLPKYRGSAPIQAAILNGDDTTGVTVIRMDEGMDTGDILAQAEVAIDENDTAGTLHDTLARVGAEVLTETVDRIEAGTVTARPQDHRRATYTKRLRKEDGVIDWNMPAEKLHNFVRAMNPWPLAHTEGGRFRVWMTSVPSNGVARAAEPGTVVGADERGLLVATLDGAIQIKQIQLAGGTPMSSREFLRGHSIQVGEKFE